MQSYNCVVLQFQYVCFIFDFKPITAKVCAFNISINVYILDTSGGFPDFAFPAMQFGTNKFTAVFIIRVGVVVFNRSLVRSQEDLICQHRDCLLLRCQGLRSRGFKQRVATNVLAGIFYWSTNNRKTRKIKCDG